VLVEKPLAIDVAAGKRLCALSKKTKRVLMVEMTHRFLPPLQEAKKLIESGAIGRVLAVDEYLIEGNGLFRTPAAVDVASEERWRRSRLDQWDSSG
jgi:predicted dehydrogenase